jgi:hypothetical protein
MLERPTDGSESGSLQDWPTASAGGFEMQDAQRLLDRRAECKAKGTNGNGFGLTLDQATKLEALGLWATPNTMDGGQTSLGGKRKGELLLGGQVRQWPTARAEDSESAGAHVARGTAETLTAAVRADAKDEEETLVAFADHLFDRLWPTATSGDERQTGAAAYSTESGRHSGTTLTDAANGLWARPQARDWKDSGPTQGARHSFNLGSQIAAGRLAPDSPSSSGKRRGWPSARVGMDRLGEAHYSRGRGNIEEEVGAEEAAKGNRGSLNPAWVSQLMGFPTGWLAASPPVTAARRSKPLATPSCPSAPTSSAKRSSRRKVKHDPR